MDFDTFTQFPSIQSYYPITTLHEPSIYYKVMDFLRHLNLPYILMGGHSVFYHLKQKKYNRLTSFITNDYDIYIEKHHVDSFIKKIFRYIPEIDWEIHHGSFHSNTIYYIRDKKNPNRGYIDLHIVKHLPEFQIDSETGLKYITYQQTCKNLKDAIQEREKTSLSGTQLSKHRQRLERYKALDC